MTRIWFAMSLILSKIPDDNLLPAGTLRYFSLPVGFLTGVFCFCIFFCRCGSFVAGLRGCWR